MMVCQEARVRACKLLYFWSNGVMEYCKKFWEAQF
jgi:hypothetical protein